MDILAQVIKHANNELSELDSVELFCELYNKNYIVPECRGLLAIFVRYVVSEDILLSKDQKIAYRNPDVFLSGDYANEI